MIKCYAIKQKSVYEFFAHKEQQEEASRIIGLVTSVEKLEGYFLTQAEIEAVFEAGDDYRHAFNIGASNRKNFADYWAEKIKEVDAK